MTEHQYWSWGGLTVPVTSDVDGTNKNLTPWDPGQATLVALFQAALNAELNPTQGTPWTTVCASLPTDHPLYGSTTPVADTLELEPTSDVMNERKATWPLLAVHRTDEVTIEPHTTEMDRLTSQWHIHWILGPRHSIETDRKFVPALTAAAKVITQVVERKGHPAYNSGALVFYSSDTSDTLGNPSTFGFARVTGWVPGQASFAGDDDGARFWALRVTLETTEYVTENVAAYPTADSMDLHVGGGTATEILPDIVIGNTDFPGTHHS